MKNAIVRFSSFFIASFIFCASSRADSVATNQINKPSITCTACQDTQKCPSCHGSGETKCSQCRGEGKVKNRCSRCGGDGRISKTTRSFGKTRRTSTSCSSCSGGYEKKNCTTCSSDGKITCTKCKGTKQCAICAKPSS